MFDLGDELTIDSYRIPWLIWIQVIVLFLLFFLLYCFSVFNSSDPSLPDNTSVITSSSSSSSSASPSHNYDKHSNTTTIRNRLQLSQVGGNQSIKGEIATSVGRRIVSDEDTDNESAHIDYHPCNYFRLAKLAFLKCLGLDCTAENSSRLERKKDR